MSAMALVRKAGVEASEMLMYDMRTCIEERGEPRVQNKDADGKEKGKRETRLSGFGRREKGMGCKRA